MRKPRHASPKSLHSYYESCTLCPRLCRVDRTCGKIGFCRQTQTVRLACAGLHFGEEPPISGRGGSGTLFFSGCTLRCSFCQNYQISHKGLGAEVTVDTLAEIYLALQRQGAENINLVTATAFTPSVIQSIALARKRGLTLPVLWNCSGYERKETLDLLDSVVDVYLPDLKSLDTELSSRLLNAQDYPGVARKALLRMAQKRQIELDGENLNRGVIVRHLVLPGELDSTRDVLRWYRENLYGKSLLSLMFQYTPVPARRSVPHSSKASPLSSAGPEGENSPRPAPSFSLPDRRINRKEYELVLDWLEDLDIEEGFIQEFGTDDSWLPDFFRENPFSAGLSRIIWHYRKGFVE
jgi:putative pyruvate formate lyase activating enzyme